MKKRLFAILLVVVMLVAAIVPASAYSINQLNTADALNSLGLFLGTGKGYELDRNLSRAEGTTMLVRMMGKEAEASEGTYDTPFTDLPAWAAGYIGYAYTNDITNGTGPKTFSPEVQLDEYMFLTLVLRALGYSDAGENPDFSWDKPYELAKKVGLVNSTVADKSFTRGDAVVVFWNAMNAEVVGKNMTLAESLIDQSVFTAEEYAAAVELQKVGKGEGGDELPTEDEDILGQIGTLPQVPGLGDLGGDGPPVLEEDIFED